MSTGKSIDEKSTIKKLLEVSKDDMILDIGPETIEMIKNIINNSNTILWNGPAGYFENPEFSKGSKEIAKQIVMRKREIKYTVFLVVEIQSRLLTILDLQRILILFQLLVEHF